MMRLASACMLLMACGSAQPPAGPKHHATNSEEAATACPKQRKQAQEARELLLGSTDLALMTSASEKVMAQADCEAAALGELALPTGTHDQILQGLRALRTQMQDADNLFSEVLRYDTPALHAQALFAQGLLRTGFADKVAGVLPPPDLDGPGKLEFQEELRQAIDILRGEAEVLVLKACEVLHGQGTDDPRCY